MRYFEHLLGLEEEFVDRSMTEQEDSYISTTGRNRVGGTAFRLQDCQTQCLKIQLHRR